MDRQYHMIYYILLVIAKAMIDPMKGDAIGKKVVLSIIKCLLSGYIILFVIFIWFPDFTGGMVIKR